MTLMPQLLGRLRRYWIAFELTEKYHPVRRRRSRDVALEAEAYCQRLSVWPLLKRSISSGASLSDYYFLHRYILSKRPKQVLEFGAGCTTLVMADALHETGGHLFSYEDVPQYYVDTDNLIPSALKNCVTLSLVDKSEVEYPPGLWGVRYVEDIAPEVEMVFVDGPFETVNGRTGACLDVLFYLDNHPNLHLDIIVDRKYGSLEAFQSVLPSGMVHYDPTMDLGFCGNCSGRMLRKDRLRPPFRISYGNVWGLLNKN
jgi:hypothetical protein